MPKRDLCLALAVLYPDLTMGRNLFILAATLLLFAMVSFGVSTSNIAQQPGSPGDTSLWRMTGLALLLIALLVALAGVLSSLFEQAERRSEQARRVERERRGHRG